MNSHIRSAALPLELRLDTLLGEVRLVAVEDGLAGIWFSGQQHEYAGRTERGSNATLETAASWLRGALDGATTDLPLPPLQLSGTPFQRQVWSALRAIPHGSRSSYGALAAQLGVPGAARAVGAAVGRNPWSVLVPCHRVLGQRGALTGYAGGIGRKRALLAREAGQDWPWRRLSGRHQVQYPDPLRVQCGDLVRWVDRPDDGEYPGWKWADATDGRGGWVPRIYFGPGAREARALRTYAAVELAAEAGDEVLELDEFSGWSLVRHRDGRVGWIPQAIL